LNGQVTAPGAPIKASKTSTLSTGDSPIRPFNLNGQLTAPGAPIKASRISPWTIGN
jgi:hypothetical protein